MTHFTTTADLLRMLSPDVADLNADLLQPGTRRKPQPAGPQVSPLAAAFLVAWRACDGPELVAEHVFDEAGGRLWRFDFAHLPSRTAIEIDGGVWGNGRHNRGAGYIEDCIKLNTATARGWHVFRLATGMITVTHVRPIVEFVIPMG